MKIITLSIFLCMIVFGINSSNCEEKSIPSHDLDYRLFLAVQNNLGTKAVKALLADGANPNARNPDNNDPIVLIAIARQNLPVLKTLVKKGADILAVDRYKRDAITWGEIYRIPEEMLQYIKSAVRKKSVKIPSSDLDYHLFLAVKDNLEVDKIKALLTDGADPNTYNPKNYDPIVFIAIAHKNVAVVEALIDAGANMLLKDSQGNDAWKLACIYDIENRWYINQVICKQLELKFGKRAYIPSVY
jgi:ankyrin repeat protein